MLFHLFSVSPKVMCDLQLVPDNAAAKYHKRLLMLKSFNITFHIESVFGTVHKESQSQTKFIS